MTIYIIRQHFTLKTKIYAIMCFIKSPKQRIIAELEAEILKVRELQTDRQIKEIASLH